MLAVHLTRGCEVAMVRVSSDRGALLIATGLRCFCVLLSNLGLVIPLGGLGSSSFCFQFSLGFHLGAIQCYRPRHTTPALWYSLST